MILEQLRYAGEVARTTQVRGEERYKNLNEIACQSHILVEFHALVEDILLINRKQPPEEVYQEICRRYFKLPDLDGKRAHYAVCYAQTIAAIKEMSAPTDGESEEQLAEVKRHCSELVTLEKDYFFARIPLSWQDKLFLSFQKNVFEGDWPDGAEIRERVEAVFKDPDCIRRVKADLTLKSRNSRVK